MTAGPPDAPAVTRDGRVGLLLALPLVLTYLVQTGLNLTGAWALSAAALDEGRWWTLLTHMFAHGGLIHLLFNSSALAAFGTQFVRFAGTSRRALTVLAAAFLVCGIAGGLAFVALNSQQPAVGASGAIFGLWGLTARLAPDGGVLPFDAAPVRSAAIQVLVVNVALAVLFSVGGGGLAWEAHLGGFLCGLLIAPLIARQL